MKERLPGTEVLCGWTTKPTLGRIVHANGMLFMKGTRHADTVSSDWLAAIVCDTRGEVTFRIVVFLYGGDTDSFDVSYADEGRTWRWPPREP